MSGRLIKISNFLIAVTMCAATTNFACAQLPNSHPGAQAEVDRIVSQDGSLTQPVNFESVGGDACCRPSGSCEATKVGCCSGTGCCDDWLTRTSLTNGLFGIQPALAEHGILADLQMTQFYQGVSSGGRAQNFNYGGKLDYMFTVDGGALGVHEGIRVPMALELWPFVLYAILGEHRFVYCFCCPAVRPDNSFATP